MFPLPLVLVTHTPVHKNNDNVQQYIILDGGEAIEEMTYKNNKSRNFLRCGTKADWTLSRSRVNINEHDPSYQRYTVSPLSQIATGRLKRLRRISVVRFISWIVENVLVKLL